MIATMERKYVGTTKNGYKVFVDLIHSHAATHILDTPNLLDLAKEALEGAEVKGENVAFEKDMGRIVGGMDLVETTDKDQIIYAKRKSRDIYTRFVKNREQTPTSFVTIVLHRIDEGYELWSAWVGRLVPSFPGDTNETPESRDFWSNHALIQGAQLVQEGTETAHQPW